MPARAQVREEAAAAYARTIPTSALSLALAAAVLHALWNVLIARSRDPEAATAVAVVLSVAVFAPVVVADWDVERDAVPYLALGGALHLAYFVLLAAAYRRAELGLVYPLSRGLAPVLVLAATAVALGDDPTAEQAVGVAIVAIGVVCVRGVRRTGGAAGTAFALAIAATIASYTLVDNEGVRHASPVPYLVLLLAGPGLVYLAVIARLKGPAALRREVRLPTLAAALAMFGSYALVLAALRLAPAAPVAAVRETSVVIAAVLAVLVLREPFSRLRLVGAAVVAAGIVVLALA